MNIKPVNIYTELTPNPNSMKFVADVMLLEGGSVEYRSKAEALNCPLASQLFDFSGITGVFITSNFITISKTTELDWFEVSNILREFIKGFLMSEEKLFIVSPFDENHIPVKSEVITPPQQIPVNEDMQPVEHDPEAEKKIIELLEEYIRPAVEGDGGAIHFKSYENGTVNVILKGACSGCPSSTVTLKAGIENLLKRMVPGVREVVAENQ